MGNEQSYLLITKGPRKDEKILLSGEPVTIGRSDTADETIRSESLSRSHARVMPIGSEYVIEDLGSTNGTFVNDERITAATALSNGDRVRLGLDVELQVMVPEIPENATMMMDNPIQAVDPGVPEVQRDATVLMSKPFAAGETMMMANQPAAPTIPPRLVVTSAGQEPEVYSLTDPLVKIGRAPDNDLVIDNPFVSRYHTELEKRGQDYYLIPSTKVINTLLLDGQPVMAPTLLKNGSKIRVGGYGPRETVTLDYLSHEGEFAAPQAIKFNENQKMTIGRDEGNDITLQAPTISRYHAEVEKIGQRYRVRDLHSSNGTFVNGKSITGETWVQPGDAIQIGPYRFVVAENEFSKFDATESGVQVKVIGLNKWVNKKLNILQDISLVFQPKEFIVVVGQSGGGKSTLVDAIAGYRPATHGRVLVNDTIDVYKEFDAIRSTIGYVPQKDIIHMELTVFQALDYAARLRMPPDTTLEERHQRVAEVMDDLDLAHRKDIQISKLSGGQQKRVSIGVELLTKPGLFFLDEPTSGLDPGMETELMRLMRRLADQGRTIVMITHATKNVMLADKVAFLARGGFLAWFGPPDEALTYFDGYRSEKDQRSTPMEFDHIYTLLDQEELGSPKEWSERFRAHPAYQKYIVSELDEKAQSVAGSSPEVALKALSKRNQVSAVGQFFILSSRYMKIITQDKFSLALLLLTAPLMASLDFVIASSAGVNPFDFKVGNLNDVIISLIVLINTSILVGGLAFMRELVKEREIYKRERMVNMHLSSYMGSKLWVVLVLAIYQAACFTIVRWIAFENPGGTQALILFYITEFLLIIAGMMLGLFASALAPNANAAPLLLILFIIPQMVLSGALVALPAAAMAPASSHWAFTSIMAINGSGSDVAADACWNLSKEEQDNLSIDYKNEFCSCMGENALHEDKCSFPGLGDYYRDAIDQADPSKPVEPGVQPEEPVLPPEPAQPADPNNIQALQLYIQELAEYNEDVSLIQDEYKSELDAWQESQEQYKTEVETYQEELTELEVERAIAIGSAESTIRSYKEDFGWTFVDKNDRESYMNVLFKAWGVQLIIIVVLFIGTVILQKQREVI